MRKVGADVLWPATLVVGTSAAGVLVGHGGGTSAATTASDVALSAGQPTIISIDVPTIAQTVLDTPKSEAR